MPQLDPKRGSRIRSIRKMTVYANSRRLFAEATGMESSTLQHWERGLGIPNKSLLRFIKGLLGIGIHATPEWILFAEGSPPERLQLQFQETNANLTEKEVQQTNTDKPSENQIIQQELNLLENHYKDLTQFLIPDDAMAPVFFPGDIVAGIRHFNEEIEKLVGQDCIVLIRGGDCYVRTILKSNLEGCYNLASHNNKTEAHQPFIYNAQLASAAPIMWMRRKIST